LQQFIVDAYACTEQNRLKFICENQQQLRCDLYNGLQDALNVSDILGNDVKQKMIFPSSFQGGERAVGQLYQDAMVVKYLYKYVYKGPYCAITVVERWVDTPSQENNLQAVIANVEWQNRDKIKAYLEGHYVFAFEASWRLFSFRMHDRTPSVTRLAMHEPRMHTVVYNDNANIFETVNSEQNQKTTLIEYFQANIDYP